MTIFISQFDEIETDQKFVQKFNWVIESNYKLISRVNLIRQLTNSGVVPIFIYFSQYFILPSLFLIFSLFLR